MARPKKAEQSTVNVSLRIDPKIRYAIELLAREQKRSITGVIEWSVMQALNAQEVKTPAGNTLTLYELMDLTWSPDEAERITALGVFSPHTLNHEENCIWTLIKSSGFFMLRGGSSKGDVSEFLPNIPLIKMCWPLIKERGVQLAEWPNPWDSKVITEADIKEHFGEDFLVDLDAYR
ncbi:hypothetical protein [Pseudomonas viridiflava]|uniref:hypothetical protein n=1 Tax=Pseudomonas viridiflava TaxID=33069 RepID=UPI000F01E395|nr:hypothetical protein [Pseudomonas viridiflava]QXG29085.1 hypothetical protein KTT59_19090 [Pseudomonas viridiflava]